MKTPRQKINLIVIASKFCSQNLRGNLSVIENKFCEQNSFYPSCPVKPAE